MPIAIRWQALGWAMVAGVDFALNRAANPFDPIGWALYAALSLGLLGWFVSGAAVALYRTRGLERVFESMPRVVAGGFASAGVWYLLSSGLDHVVGYPYRTPVIEGLFGRGALCLFIMLAWHGAASATRATERAARAEQHAHEARLMALRYQLNPHFLFNSINSAVALIDESPKRAQRMLTLLSHLLRDTLSTSTTRERPLEGELNLIERYLEIEGVRFEDDLRVEVDVSESAKRCLIPPLLIHTLVENAVKHGFRTAAAKPIAVSVSSSFERDTLRIEVTNTGRLSKDPSNGGIGLRNLQARLEATYPQRHSFDISERAGKVSAVVEIDAPASAP